jgi:hypothetical protein
MQKVISAYIYSAGSLLLALATALVLANLHKQPLDFVPAHELLFDLRLPVLFWIVAGILTIVALQCLFGRQTGLQLTLLLWMASNLVVYRLGLHYMGAKGGVRGYLGELADVFGCSTVTMTGLLTLAVGYLLLGSLLSMLMERAWEIDKRTNPSMKMICAQCGGHIQFSLRNLGQIIPCPHCEDNITLRHPDETLKIPCYFCHEHIEFPAHALGRKIKCPHCGKEIPLTEPS